MRGHVGHHVVWLGLSGEADWDLMPRIVENNFTFVTNNAADFRKLYAREDIHAGLIIIVPLDTLAGGDHPINEVFEVWIENDEIVIDRYAMPT